MDHRAADDKYRKFLAQSRNFSHKPSTTTRAYYHRARFYIARNKGINPRARYGSGPAYFP